MTSWPKIILCICKEKKPHPNGSSLPIETREIILTTFSKLLVCDKCTQSSIVFKDLIITWNVLHITEIIITIAVKILAAVASVYVDFAIVQFGRSRG